MKNIFSSLLTIISFAAFSQERTEKKDSVESLFGRAHYSYTQLDIGYAGFAFQDVMLNGVDFNYGVALNNKFVISFGLDAAAAQNVYLKQYPNYNKELTYMQGQLTLEFLHKPNKLFNLSIPIKLAWANVNLRGMNSNNYGNYISATDDNFFVAEPGARIFVNLFPALSLGGGVSYRISFGSSLIGSDNDFRNYSVYALLRFKLFTREWYKRQMQRQREWMKMWYGQGQG